MIDVCVNIAARKVAQERKQRLEDLRVELQSLSKYIDKDDTELLEAAGVPE
jgi:uncharacterized OsmC-like protein